MEPVIRSRTLVARDLAERKVAALVRFYSHNYMDIRTVSFVEMLSFTSGFSSSSK